MHVLVFYIEKRSFLDNKYTNKNYKYLFFSVRIVFPNRKKAKKEQEIVHKKYILTSETYEFGPLLVGKSRDK